jgi:hypothetical protein
MTVKIGALCWNQYTQWPALLGAGQRVDRLRAPLPAPYDEESMTRYATEVRPRLERARQH